MNLPARPAARAIIIRDGMMLVIKREKNGMKYMVTPGGRVENGETPEETVLREVTEETTVRIAAPKLVFIEEPNDGRWGTQYIYLCEYESGEAVLNPESEEYTFQQQGGGKYEPMWLEFGMLDDKEYPFKSPRLGQEIREAIKSGFPEVPKKWTLPAV